jgi:hypothetical protein
MKLTLVVHTVKVVNVHLYGSIQIFKIVKHGWKANVAPRLCLSVTYPLNPQEQVSRKKASLPISHLTFIYAYHWRSNVTRALYKLLRLICYAPAPVTWTRYERTSSSKTICLRYVCCSMSAERLPVSHIN